MLAFAGALPVTDGGDAAGAVVSGLAGRAVVPPGAEGMGGSAGMTTGRRYMAVRRSSIVSSVFGRARVAPQPEQNLASTLLSVPQMLHFIAVPREATGRGGLSALAPRIAQLPGARWPTARTLRLMINENVGPQRSTTHGTSRALQPLE